MTYFKATTDKTAKIITALFVLLIIVLAVSSFMINDRGTEIARVITAVFLLALMLGCFLYAPKGYGVESGNLVIKRVGKDRIIPFSQIQSVKEINRDQLRGSIRTFGVGGLFGYWGKFNSPAIGSTTWYITQRKNLILITLQDGEKILLSPDEPGLANLLPAA